MKNVLVLVAFLTLSTLTHASNGSTVGCFDMMSSVPGSFGQYGSAGQALPVKTNASLCVTEKNMVQDPTNDMVRTGEIAIKVLIANKVKANYLMKAATDEGALGTIYTTYAVSKDLLNLGGSPDPQTVIVFGMLNDHISKGHYAGHVEIGGERFTLIQK